MKLFDIGANLIGRSYSRDLPEVLHAAREAGVEKVIVTGTDLDVSTAAAELAESEAGVWSTAGVHPHDAKHFTDSMANAIEALAARPEVVAIGECGLDFNRNYSPRPAQLHAFEQQLTIASRTGLPLFLHERDAHEEFLAILRNAWPDLNGGAVVHCFTGGPDVADTYLELGCHLGITGWVCDERRGGDLRNAVKMIPGERLLLETDAPYLLPRTIRPKPKSRRNEPRHLTWVVREVAELRGEDPHDTARAAWDATHRVFGMDSM